MTLVATSMSQVPAVIEDCNSTFPETILTLQVKAVVDPFKSGDDTSENAVPALSQVAYT